MAISPRPSATSSANLASQILMHPGKTILKGGRPAGARRWSWVSLRALRLAVISLATGVATQVALLPSGLPQEVIARVSPSQPIASAPEDSHWVALPTSPFLEVGRLKSGGFSLLKMLDGWRDAGLPADQATKVAASVSLLRPVLMGRWDPVLEAQLGLGAGRAAMELKTGYPEVFARLKAGQTVQLTAQERKMWLRTSLLLEDRLMESPLPRNWKLDVLVRRAVSWNRAVLLGDRHFEDPLPIVGFLKAGLFNHGESWSAEHMLNVWRSAGIKAETARLLLQELPSTIPDVSGMSRLEASLRTNRAWQSSSSLEQHFREDLEALELAEKSPRGEPTLFEKVAAGAEGDAWKALFVQLKSQGEDPARPDASLTIAKAKQVLAEAVQTVGLRSVSLSFEQWQSPASVAEAARRLVEANRELSRATGWKGKVLGLDGRVELALGKPITMPSASGVVTARKDNRLQMVAEWGSVGHEWFHAFDLTVSRLALAHSTSGPLSANLQPLRSVVDVGVYGDMKNLLNTTEKKMPKWRAAREGVKDNASYWSTSSEVLAFAFSSYLAHHVSAPLLASSNDRESIAREPERGPSDVEAAVLIRPFRQLFSAAAPLGLQGIVASNLKDKVSHRREAQSPMGTPAPEDLTRILANRTPTVR